MWSDSHWVIDEICWLLECQGYGQEWNINIHQVAGVSRRQINKNTKMFKNVNIIEFSYFSWNHHEKCIEISTNMPSTGLVIREIDVDICANWENNNCFCAWLKQRPRDKG